MTLTQRTPFPKALAVFCIALAMCLNAHASEKTWNNSGTTWTTSTNWGGGAPANSLTTDTALFNSTSFTTPTTGSGVTNIAGITVGDGATATGALTFATSAGTFAIGSGGVLVKGDGSTTLAGRVNLANVTLGATQTWTNNGYYSTPSQAALYAGAVTTSNSFGAGPYTLTLAGSGTSGATPTTADGYNFGIDMSGIISQGNGTTLSLVVQTTGLGLVSLNGLNSFTGGLTVKSGIVKTATATSLGAGAVILGDSSNSLNAVIRDASGASNIIGNAITVEAGSGLRSLQNYTGQSVAIYSGAITLNNGNLQIFADGQGGTSSAYTQVTGGFTGTGNLSLYSGVNTLLTGAVQISGADINMVGTITNNGNGTASTAVSAVIGANVTGVTQNSTTSKLVLTGTNTYTAATTITAGTLQIGDGTTDGSIANSSGITDNGTLAYNLVGTQTYANSISGSGSVTKTGAGTIILSGSNSYGGLTTVTTGTLKIGQTNAIASGNSLTTGASGTFDLNGYDQTLGLVTNGGIVTNSSGTTKTLTIGNGSTGAGSFTGAMNLIWNQGASNSAITGTTLGMTGNLTLNATGAGTIGFTTANNTGTVTNAAGGGAGTTTITTVGSNVTGVTENSSTSALTVTTLNMNAAGTTLTSGGTSLFTVTNQITTGSSSNLTLSANSTGNITLTNGFNIGGSILNNGGGTNTVTVGAIGALVTTGVTENAANSILLLNGAGLYTGGTTVTSGTLKVGNATALGANTSAVSVASGAALDVNGTTMTGTNALTLNGSGTGAGALINSSNTGATYAGAVNLASDSTIGSTGTGNAFTVSGSVTSTGTKNLTITAGGSQAITLTNVNNTGTVTNSGGGAGTATITTLGSNVTGVTENSSTSALTVTTLNMNAAGTTLTSGGTSLFTVTNQITTGSSSNLTLSANSTGNITLTNGFNIGGSILNNGGGTNTVTVGAIGALVTTGVTENAANSILLLNGAGLYTGGTTVTLGTLKVGNATALGANTSAVSVASGAVLDVNGTTMTGTNALTLNGTGILGTGALINSSNTAATYAGAVNLASDSTIGSTGTGNAFTVSGSVTSTGTKNLTIKAGGTQAITLTNVNNTGTVTNSGGGAGTATITTLGSNVTGVTENSTTSGLTVTTLNVNGTTGTTLTNSNASGTSLFTVTNAVAGTGNLVINNNSSIANGITLTGGVNNIGTVTNSGTGTGTETIAPNIGTNISSVIQSSATSQLTLSGLSNTFAGGIRVNAGFLYASTQASTGTGTITLGSVGGSENVVMGLGTGTATNVWTIVAGTGTRTIQNGTGNITLTGPIALNNNLTLDTIAAGNKSISVTGAITGSATITIANSSAGTGITTLDGNSSSTYSGQIQVNTGATFAIGPTAMNFGNSIVTLSGTAKLSANQSGTIAGLNGDSTSQVISGGASKTLTIAGSGNYTYNGVILADTLTPFFSPSITKTGTGTQTLTNNNTYTGATTVNGGTLQAGVSSVANTSGAFGKNSAVIMGNFSGAILDLNGYNTQIGSLTGGGATGGNVTLGTATLSVGGDNTSPGTYAGVISGTGGALTKIGTGTLTLSGANTYTGNTTVTGGLIALNGAEIAGTSGPLGKPATLANSIVLQGGGLQFSTNNTYDYTTSGRLQLADGSTGTIDTNAQTVTFANAIGVGVAKTGALTKAGSGTLVLGGANTYSGVTSINGGTLQISAANNLGDSSSSNTISLNGGTLDSTAGTYDLGANRAIALTGTGTIQSDAGTLTVSGNISTGANSLTVNGAGNTTITGAITGSNGLIKKGGGTLTLSGANTFTGGTLLLYASGGTLALNGDYSTTGATLSIQNQTNFSAVGQARTWGGKFGGLSDAATTVNFNGTQDLTFSSLSAVTSQFQSGAGARIINSGSGVLTFAGTDIGISNGRSNTTFELSGSSNWIVVSAAITDGAGQTGNGLVLSGNYGATLSGANTFTGSLQLNYGTLNVATLNNNGVAGVFGNSSNPLLLSGANPATATLNFTGSTAQSSNKGILVFAGAATTVNIQANGTGLMTLSGGITAGVSSGRTLGFGGDGTGGGLISGAISDGSSSGYTVNKYGLSTWTFSGNNTYTGATTVTGGTLKVGNASALGFGGIQTTATKGTTVNSGFTLDLNGTTGINEPITLNGTGIGANGALVNNSGTPARIENGIAGLAVAATGSGSGYSAAPTVVIGGTGSSATATASLGVTAASISLTGGGTGWVAGDTFTVNGGGTGALFTVATVTGGAISTFTLTSAGTGYTTAPTTLTKVTSTSGAGATITGNATNFTVGGLAMTNAGSGYTGTPTFTFNGVTATVTPTLSSVILAANSSIGGTGDTTINAVVSGGTNGLTKVGSGTLTLAGANTYTGATSVSAGTLAVSGAGTLATTSLTVANGATFSYVPTTIGTNLTLGTASTLGLNDGSSLTLAWNTTTANKITALGAATVGTGAGVGLNMGTGFTSGTTYTILAAGSGLGTGSYHVLNNTDYTAIIGKTATAVTITPTAATPITAAYWKGSATTGLTQVWAASNGSSASPDSNWATSGGAVQALVPGSTADVTIQNAGTAATNTTLGANMSIKTLTLADTTNATALNADGHTLTITPGASTVGITMNTSVKNSTLAAPIVLGAAQTWTNNSTAGTLTLNGAVTGGYALTVTGPGNTTIGGAISTGANTLSTSSTGTLTLSGANTYSGATTVGNGTLSFNTVAAGAAAQALGGGTTVNLGVAGTSSGILSYTGGTGTLDKTINALGNGTDTIQNSGTGALTLSGSLVKNHTKLTLSGGSNGIIVTGTISGGTTSDFNSDLNVTAGTTTINTAGTYTGPTNIYNAGILINGAASVLPAGTVMTIGASTDGAVTNTYNLGGFNQTIAALNSVSNAGTTNINTVTNTGTSTLTLSGVNSDSTPVNGSFGGVIGNGTGTTSLTVAGGTQTFSGANTYTGATLVNSGATLALGINNAISSSSALTLGGASTTGSLNMGAYTDSVASLTIAAGGGTITLNGSTTPSPLSSTGALTLNGNLTLNVGGTATTAGLYHLLGFGSQSGSGTVSASGINSAYTLISDSPGDYDLQHKAVIGTIAATPAAAAIITGGSTAFTFTVANSAPTSSASLAFSAASGTNTTGSVAGPVSVAPGATSGATSGLTFNGSTVGAGQTGSFTVNDAASTNTGQTGSVTVDVYDHASPVSTPVTLALGNVHAGYGSPVSSNSFTVANGTNGDYRVNLKGTAAAGSNNVSINSFTGLQANGSTQSLAATLATGVAGGTVLNQSITYTYGDDSTLSGANSSLSSPSLNVTGQVYSGNMVWNAGSSSWGTNASWNDSANSAVHVAPGLDSGFASSDTATFGTAGSGGTVNLNGAAPSLTGITFNNAGASYTLAKGTGGSVTLNNGVSSATLTDSNGSHTVSADVVLSSNLAVAVANGGDALTVSGNISGSGKTLTKTGAGALLLSGTNSYTGTTTVSSGTLLINGNSSAATGAVAVNGGTLGGSGTIGGAVTVNASGFLAPGNSSAGILTVSSLALNSTSTVQFEVNGTATAGTDYDQVVVSGGGALALNGAFTIAFGNTSDLANTTDINLISYSSSHTGDFTSLVSTGYYGGTGATWSHSTGTDTFSLSSGGQTLTFSELTGNLTVVPEPATWALLAFSLTTVMIFRRRRNP